MTPRPLPSGLSAEGFFASLWPDLHGLSSARKRRQHRKARVGLWALSSRTWWRRCCASHGVCFGFLREAIARHERDGTRVSFLSG